MVLSLIITSIIIYLLYFGMCYIETGTDDLNMISFSAYPNEVQELVKKDKYLSKKIPRKKSYLQIFVLNTIIFTIIFFIISIFFRNQSRTWKFIFFLILGEGLNIFDFLVIDILWWRNSERIKFSRIKEQEKYKDIQNHFYGFLRGIPVFIVTSIIVSGIFLEIFK